MNNETIKYCSILIIYHSNRNSYIYIRVVACVWWYANGKKQNEIKNTNERLSHTQWTKRFVRRD